MKWVARNLTELSDLDSQRDEAQEIIAAVIGVRSYNTAITRANSILKFLKFVLEMAPNVKQPFQEELMWKYFNFLKVSGGAITAATTLSAFRYAKHIMGFYNLDCVLESRRLKDYSELLYAGKRTLRQALTLTVQQVKVLHSKMEDPEVDAFDRAAAAFMLVAIYGRCRVSDLAFLDNVKHNHNYIEGFVELFTAVHKTGRSAVKKATLLPILAPAIRVTGNNWPSIASEVFEMAGLNFSGAVSGPLLRPPSHQGPFLCQRGVTSSEVGKLLRGLVGEAIDIPSPLVPHLSAHSLKATGLAWAARYGLAWPDRSILGRHQFSTNETVAVYSRDLAVGPVTKFAGVLASIFKGAFCPDAERSKHFPFPPVPPEQVGFAEVNQGTAAEAVDEQGDGVTCKDEGAAPIFAEGFLVIEDSESDSTESASSESGESSASEDMEPPVKRRNAAPTAGIPKHGLWVAHRKSGLLHYC